MAYYALIDSSNIVVHVISGVDEDVTQTDSNGLLVGGSSEAWENFYSSRPWFDGLTCKRTSYNNRIRKNYAGIGYTYDEVRDAFIPPKCHDEAVLVEATCLWDCDNEAHTTII